MMVGLCGTVAKWQGQTKGPIVVVEPPNKCNTNGGARRCRLLRHPDFFAAPSASVPRKAPRGSPQPASTTTKS